MSWSTAPKGGGKPKFPWTKPNNHAGGGPTEAEARLLASMRSAFHEAQCHSPSTSKWSHRQPEWECAQCKCRNFLTRDACRDCGQLWRPGLMRHPAGAPPPQHGQLPAPQNAGTKGGGEEANTVKAAEAALAAARAAGLSAESTAPMEKEVESRRAALQAQRPLAQRLQLATSKAKTAHAVETKAEEKLQKSQVELAEAKVAAAAAEEELRRIRAEVAAQDQPTAKQAPDPANALTKLLEALKAADRGDEGGKERLAAAATAAEHTLNPPAQAASTAAVRPREEEPLATQEGNMDLDDDALEKLLSNLPASKRARVADRLTQLGVQEQEQLLQQQQQQQQQQQEQKK